MIEARLRRLFTEQFADVTHARFVAAEAPGRLEISGNHTDHQGGCVLSAALNYYITALAAPNGRDEIRVVFDGFGTACITLPLDCAPQDDEIGTSNSLLRGMAAAYLNEGGGVEGFDMAVCSTIPPGGGVSSSAALEMLIGVVLRALDAPELGACVPSACDECAAFNRADALCASNERLGDERADDGGAAKLSAACNRAGELVLSDAERTALALQGQHTEQAYFGKMCGAQDQLASALGGLVFMDFGAPIPQTQRIAADFSAAGYDLVLINSGVDHSAYNDEYDQVPKDMFEVARYFKKTRLVDVSRTDFLAEKAALEQAFGAEKVQRAEHFFEENARVKRQVALLHKNEFTSFLQEVIASGESSANKLGNVTPRSAAPDDEQAKLPQRILDHAAECLPEQGAWRIHGGGFGGSVLAFVPHAQTQDFVAQMEELVAPGACMIAGISADGARAWRVSAQEALSSFAWKGQSDFGELELTINLVKPEKDPLNIKQATCALCEENNRFNLLAERAVDARVEHPAFEMNGEPWRLHFSPYGYYPKHCIVMAARHYPMAITQRTCEMLLACVDRWPYYFMGSNADLPIVGGSILEHDHFQGGGHVFPLMKRPMRQRVSFANYLSVEAGIVDWPASVLRLQSADAQALADCAWEIIRTWKSFACAPCELIPRTEEGQHSTVTPIAYRAALLVGADAKNTRMGGDAKCACACGDGAESEGTDEGYGKRTCADGKDACAVGEARTPPVYVLDLVLRNNRTTEARPFGIFHPDVDLHHIKKENIGLIEIMGRAILPPRVLDIYPQARTSPQMQRELTQAFQAILEATGVFKDDAAGQTGWKTFIEACGGVFCS